MFELLYSFNLFPYFQLWRIGSKPYHNNKCSIMASVLIFVIISIILVISLHQVFQKNTLAVTSHTIISSEPPHTTIVTSKNNSDFQPFMFGFDFIRANPHINHTHPPFTYSAYVDHLFPENNTSNLTNFNESINLVSCTTEHFSNFPQIK